MSVLRPTTIDEAVAVLSAQPEAIPIAGGTDLMVHWPHRLELHEKTFVDLSRLTALRGLRWQDGDLVMGALTTYWDVLLDEQIGRRFPLLHRAARQVGAVQIQTRGTWAGNVGNGSPAADGVAVLMAYDAMVELTSVRGVDVVPLRDFYTGYKISHRTPDQLITAIRLPGIPYRTQIFEKVGARKAQAISKIGVAMVEAPGGWVVVANSMAPTIRRCRAVEAVLNSGHPISSPEALHDTILQDVHPIDDLRSTGEYRVRVMARLLYHDLREHIAAFS